MAMIGMKRKAKRQVRRWKKKTNRRMNISRPVRFRQQMLTLKRKCYAGVIQPGTAATSNFWNFITPTIASAGPNFNGGNLQGIFDLTDFTNMFDLYKLNAVKFEFKPRVVDYNMPQTSPSGGTYVDIPYVSILLDSTNVVVPSGTYTEANYNQFNTLGNVKVRRADKPWSIYLKPKVREQYGAGAHRYVKPQWTNTDSAGTAVEYRGFHMFFHNQNFTTTFNTYNVYVTYYIQFKGMR